MRTELSAAVGAVELMNLITYVKENGNIFFIGLLIKIFEVIVTSVVNFLVTYLVSEILKTSAILFYN